LEEEAVKVGIVMGSSSDAEIMDGAVQALREFDVEVEVRVLSAHRTPLDTLEYAKTAKDRGISVLIAGAGGAAHLAGVIAAATALPVIGVPIALQNLQGLDSLLSMVQMPRGVPVAVVAINGSRNAGLLAVRIMAVADDALSERYKGFHEEMAAQVRTQDKALQDRYDGGEGSS
jgi:5-(carboxyamino)imidazole ribonucleotide mutase